MDPNKAIINSDGHDLFFNGGLECVLSQGSNKPKNLQIFDILCHECLIYSLILGLTLSVSPGSVVLQSSATEKGIDYNYLKYLIHFCNISY